MQLRYYKVGTLLVVLAVALAVLSTTLLASARENEFEVVGVSPTFSQFLGAPTAFLLLSELQEVTWTTGADRAGQIIVTLESGAEEGTVERELQAAYPEYEVRTNQEQLQSVLQGQAQALASALVLVVLAVLAGVTLTVNVSIGMPGGIVAASRTASIRPLSELG